MWKDWLEPSAKPLSKRIEPFLRPDFFSPIPLLPPPQNRKKPTRRSYTIYRNMAENEGDPDGRQVEVMVAEATPAGTSAGDSRRKVREGGRCPCQGRWRTMAYVGLMGIFVFVVGKRNGIPPTSGQPLRRAGVHKERGLFAGSEFESLEANKQPWN